MPFIRLSDDFDDHPKFSALSDGAFRLWCQTLAYSRRYETDGVVPLQTVKTRRAYSAPRVAELVKPWKAGENPLWKLDDGSIVIHDYLEWNHSKAETQAKREQDAGRQRKRRLTPLSQHVSQRDNVVTVSGQHAVVPDMGMDLREEKESNVSAFVPVVVAERRDVPDRRFVPRRLGRGVFTGQLPSDHLDHAVCSPNLSWCVPNAVHARLVTALSPKYAGDRAKADDTLKAWYPTVYVDLPQDTVIADDFKFWRAKAAAVFSSPTQGAQPSGRVVPSASATDELLANIKAGR